MLARQHGPSQRLCIIGLAADAADVSRVLATLPADAYGQVLLVGAPDEKAPPAPARVMITRPVVEASSEAVRRVVAAWISEWIPDEPWLDPAPRLWLGRAALELMGDEPVVAGRSGEFATLPEV